MYITYTGETATEPARGLATRAGVYITTGTYEGREFRGTGQKRKTSHHPRSMNIERDYCRHYVLVQHATVAAVVDVVRTLEKLARNSHSGNAPTQNKRETTNRWPLM